MSTMEKLEERQFILECIQLYEILPALWNTKSKDYSNRDKKNQQYERLLYKYRERFPNADKTDLIRKFNSLRTNFRKELKKIRGACTEDACEPTLWYFDQMKFLINIDDLRSYQNSMTDDNEVNELEREEIKDIHTEGIDNFGESIESEKESEPKPKKKKPNSSTDELVRLATQRLRDPPDSCHQLGIVWGNKLTRMDRNQRIIAEKVINEVMFNGELGLLNFNTTLTNINSAHNLNPLSSALGKKTTTINTSESSVESTSMNNYTIKCGHSPTHSEAIPQRFSVDDLNYPSSSPLVNAESITDHDNEQTSQNFVVSEYDPLDNLIKIEE